MIICYWRAFPKKWSHVNGLLIAKERFTRREFKGQMNTGRPRFGSVAVRGWNGSSGSGFRFRRFLCKKGFSVFQYICNRKGRFRFRFRFLENVPAVPVPLLVSGKTVPTVPVPGSGSVPEPFGKISLNYWLEGTPLPPLSRSGRPFLKHCKKS